MDHRYVQNDDGSVSVRHVGDGYLGQVGGLVNHQFGLVVGGGFTDITEGALHDVWRQEFDGKPILLGLLYSLNDQIDGAVKAVDNDVNLYNVHRRVFV